MSEQAERESGSPFVITVPTKATMLITVGLVMLGLAFLYVETYNMVPSFLPGYPGDAFLPRVILIFSMFWAAVILVRGLILTHEAAAVGQEEPYVSVHWLEFVTIVVLVVLYAQLLRRLGFEIVTFALLMILLVPRMAAGPGMTLAKALLQGTALSVVTTLVLYVGLGPLLKIQLPLWFLPDFLF